MIAAVWIVLALAAAGGATAVWRHQNEGATGASMHPEKSVAMCLSQPVFCTQEYLPKTCRLKIRGADTSASGNNGCQALSALREALCAAGHASIAESTWTEVRCTRID